MTTEPTTQAGPHAAAPGRLHRCRGHAGFTWYPYEGRPCHAALLIAAASHAIAGSRGQHDDLGSTPTRCTRPSGTAPRMTTTTAAWSIVWLAVAMVATIAAVIGWWVILR